MRRGFGESWKRSERGDPDELHNVVAEHPDVAAEYHEKLMDYIEKNRELTRGSLEVGDAAFTEVPLFDQSRL